MNWIEHPVNLEGEKVKLVPLDSAHFNDLVNVARNMQIWEYVSAKCDTDDKTMNFLRSAVLKRGTGEQYPFTVIDKGSNRVIGHTMFHNLVQVHKKLEIGWTWYHPDYWRTGYNRECKLLMLAYCFEVLGTGRVQLQTDEINLRSKAAIAGIGATFEGIIRHDRIKDNGDFRNTAMYSIISTEWDAVKAALQAKIK